MLRLLAACVVLVLAGCHSSSAISGGVTTSIKNHPYQVAIDQSSFDEVYDIYVLTMICTGALLTTKTVVTAASCFSNYDSVNVSTLSVRVGAQLREGGGEAYKVTDFVQHPDFEKGDGGSDVLMLFLEADVPFRAEVHSLPLVDPTQGITAGEKLIITGYGDLQANEKLPDDQVRQLQVATLPFINQDLCNDIYYISGDNRACAGGITSGMCGSRDIGAPLVNWHGELVGVAKQMYNECGEPGIPTMFSSFADVAINKWIIDNVGGIQ